MKKKQFVVIGLGRFGASVAKTLYNLGNDVLAVDHDEEIVQSIADKVTHSVQLDATDENSLKSLGISNFDVAVVTIGADIQSSIMVTLLIKELGVKYVICKANSEPQAKVLYKVGADKVVLPERDMGIRVAHSLVSTNVLDYIELSREYNIAEIAANKVWHGKSMIDLDLRARCGLNVMAIKTGEKIIISPNANYVIKPDDIIVVIGGVEQLSHLEELSKNN